MEIMPENNRISGDKHFQLYTGQAFESSDSIGKSYITKSRLRGGTVNMYVRVGPSALPGKMYDLGDENLKLKEPLDIIYKIYPEEVLALLPELELVGEGINEMHALEDLKCEFLDLYEYLAEMPEEKLGQGPRAWKHIFQRIIQT